MNSTVSSQSALVHRVSGAEIEAGAVSWPAIFAGAASAAALSLILLVLGAGLGFGVVSPWSGTASSAQAISWSAIAWICFMALASSGLGGYLAGRLRVRWSGVHGDEAYFRDTAHGLLAWAVATLLTAAVLTTAIGALLGGVTAAAPAIASGLRSEPESTPLPLAYAVDSLYRLAPAADSSTRTDPRSSADAIAAMNSSKTEATRIFLNSIHTGALSADDQRYTAQLVQQRTGLPQQEAEARVTAAYTGAQQKLQQAAAQARQLADEGRKHAAYAALWLFVSLLGGAFFASLMATFGGRKRDLN